MGEHTHNHTHRASGHDAGHLAAHHDGHHGGHHAGHDEGHDAGHDAGHHGVHQHERRTRWVVLVTTATMVVELVVGYASGSMALVADGWHMATHAAALGMAAVAYWFARTRAGHRAFSFGTGKVYALAGYTSAVALALVAVALGVESISRLWQPVAIAFAEALPVAVLGLLVNIVCAWLLEAGDHDHDHNLRSAYVHVVADAFTSLLAIGALLGGRYLGWAFLDPLMGIVGALVILRWAWNLCGGAARQLLDVTPSDADEAAARAALEGIDDVRVLALHLWDLGPQRRAVIASIVTATPRAVEHYREALHTRLALAHVTIEVRQGPSPGASRRPGP